jgi:hypothetical protein
MIEILPYAEFHRHINTRKQVSAILSRTTSCNIHFLGQCPLLAREQVMTDEQMTWTLCNLIPDLRVCYYQTVTSSVHGETLNS